MAPQAVEATIGGFQREKTRQLEEQYRANQDQYYETQRQRVAQEIKAGERATEVNNIVLEQRRRLGDDPVAVIEWGMGQPDADVLGAVEEWAARKEENRLKALDNDTRERTNQLSVFAGITRDLDAIERSNTPMESYQKKVQGFKDALIEVGIPPETVNLLLPQMYDADVLTETADRGRTQIEKGIRADMLAESMKAWGGGTKVPDDPKLAIEFLDATEKSMLLGLRDVDSQEQLDDFWIKAKGDIGDVTSREYRLMDEDEKRAYNRPLFPDQIIDKYSEFLEYSPEKWEDLERMAQRRLGEEETTGAEVRALNCLMAGDMDCYNAIIRHREEWSAAARAPTDGDGGDGRDGDGDQSSYSSRLAWRRGRNAITNRTYASDDSMPPPNRYNPTTEKWVTVNPRWASILEELQAEQRADDLDKETKTPDLKMSDLPEAELLDAFYLEGADVEEDDRWYNADQSQELLDVIDENHFGAAQVPNNDELDNMKRVISDLAIDDDEILDSLGDFPWKDDIKNKGRSGSLKNRYLYRIPEDYIWVVMEGFTDEYLEDLFSPFDAAAIRARFHQRGVAKSEEPYRNRP